MNPTQIIALVAAAAEVLRIASAAKEALVRKSEWSPEAEREFATKLADVRKSPAWQVAP